MRDFLVRELPAGWIDYYPATAADHVSHNENGWEVFKDTARKFGEKGWLSLCWPGEYGDKSHSFVDNFIFLEEIARRASPGYNAIAARMLGPTLSIYGTEEQKESHLGPIAAGQIFWCEGFSEPEAGSDLAALKTSARIDNDHFVINGQKTWSTFAEYSDWCFVLARTDPESTRHRGLTFILVDLSTPGITISPILNMAGEPSFSEIFFDDVRVPRENAVGELGAGWQVVQTLLSFERGSIEHIARVESLIERLKGIDIISRDTGYRQALAQMAIDAEIGRLLNYRVAWLFDRGTATEWHAAMAKLYSTELFKRGANTAMELLGLYGQLDRRDILAPLFGWFENYYLVSFGATIAAGTSEIQRTIIALRSLELPRA